MHSSAPWTGLSTQRGFRKPAWRTYTYVYAVHLSCCSSSIQSPFLHVVSASPDCSSALDYCPLWWRQQPIFHYYLPFSSVFQKDKLRPPESSLHHPPVLPVSTERPITGTLVNFVAWNSTGSDQRSLRADGQVLDLLAVHTAEHLESHAQPGGRTHVHEP